MADSPLRLHGFLVAHGSRALVFRRHGDETATFSWNQNDDSFSAGQRLAGRVYVRRSDLSPGGGYLLFLAVDEKGERWTGISRSPLLSSQVYWPKTSHAYGGGMFCGPRRYWLNEGDGHEEMQGQMSSLERQHERPSDVDWGPGCAGVYVPRLQRDGWELIEVRKNAEDVVTAHVFEKPIDDQRVLRRYAWTPPPWDDVTRDTHGIVDRESGEEEAKEDWDWADVDRNRLIWSIGGTIYAAPLGDFGIGPEQALVDLGTFRFRR